MKKSFDIIVPTFNRPEDISKFIAEIQKQNYPNYHIWIVDDHGNKPIKHLIPENSNFTFIRLPENKGQAYARNIPLESGKNNIIISMDDDAWFDNNDKALHHIAEYFDKYDDLGCLAFNISTPLTQYNTQKNNGEEVPLHITCGCAYNREVLEKIGGFSGFIHSQAEETDISLKIISLGYKIRFTSEIKLFHNFNPGIRSKKWYRYMRKNTTRNDMLIVVMRYPLNLIPIYLFGKYISHIVYDIKRWNLSTAILVTFSAFFGFLIKLPKAIRFRTPISLSNFRYWRSLLTKR